MKQTVFDFPQLGGGRIEYLTVPNHPIVKTEKVEQNVLIEDDIFDEAVRAILRHGRCSSEFLHRKLRVTFIKAAMIVQYLESRSIVGKRQDGTGLEPLITEADYFG